MLTKRVLLKIANEAQAVARGISDGQNVPKIWKYSPPKPLGWFSRLLSKVGLLPEAVVPPNYFLNQEAVERIVNALLNAGNSLEQLVREGAGEPDEEVVKI